jgi:hypothetical protein
MSLTAFSRNARPVAVMNTHLLRLSWGLGRISMSACRSKIDNVCVIVVFGTWKAREIIKGVCPSFTRIRWFSTLKCEIRKPFGNFASSKARMSCSIIPISLKKTK